MSTFYISGAIISLFVTTSPISVYLISCLSSPILLSHLDPVSYFYWFFLEVAYTSLSIGLCLFSVGHWSHSLLSVHHLFCEQICPSQQALSYYTTWHMSPLSHLLLLVCGVSLFSSSPHRKSSADIDVCFTCCCVLVMIHPVFITLMLYDLPLLSSESCPTTMPCVHGLPSSHFTATLNPADRNRELTFPHTDQKKQACLAVKACQLKNLI